MYALSLTAASIHPPHSPSRCPEIGAFFRALFALQKMEKPAISQFAKLMLGVVGLFVLYLLLDATYFFSFVGLSPNPSRYSKIQYPQQPPVGPMQNLNHN